MSAPKYYHAYGDRYQSVYAQGIEYWSGDPADVDGIVRLIDAFLDYYGLQPDGVSIVEFGCGEGYLAEHLLEKGHAYQGIDLAESALEKARKRIGHRGLPNCFVNGDVTSLPGIPAASFDAAIDNFTLHMLLTDSDRESYLLEVARVLKPGGCAFFHENLQDDVSGDPVASADEYCARFFPDAGKLGGREVYDRGEMKTVNIPRLPFRGNSCEGYRDELSQAGLSTDKTIGLEYSCVIYVRRGAER